MTPSATQQLEIKLRKTEELRLAALVAADLHALEHLLHPDLEYTHSTGRVDNRQSLLELMASGTTRYMSLSHEFTLVSIEHDVATTQGTMILNLVSNSVQKQLKTTTRTRWLLVDGQFKLRSFIGEKAA